MEVISLIPPWYYIQQQLHQNMFLAKWLTSKRAYFLKSIPPRLWSVTLIFEIKSEKVFDNILGIEILKQQSYISGLSDLTPSTM